MSTVGPEIEFLSDFDTIKIYWPNSEDLNQQLIALVLQKEQEDTQGIRITNRGGWHSKQDALQWEGNCIKELIARLQVAKKELARYVPLECEVELTMMWANINRDGHFNYPHWHNAYWSGFYCVSDGNPDPSCSLNGVTGLVRGLDGRDLGRLPWKLSERPRNIEKSVREYIYPATEGSLLMFPGKLMHYVNTYHGKGERITIAFNFQKKA